MTDKPSGADDVDPEIDRMDDGSELMTASSSDADFDPADTRDQATAPNTSRLGLMAGFLALIVAIASAVGVGYLWLTDDPPETESVSANEIADLNTELERAQSELARLERQVSSLSAQGAPPDVDVAAIERRVEQRLRGQLGALNTLPARVASTEQAISTLRGISTGARDAWLLAEAEYYMQIANAQLQLAANPALAALALKLADERLVELGDPGLTDVRRTLAREIQTLDVLEAPDTEGAALTLAGLSRVVDSLPMKQEIASRSDESAPLDDGLSGTDRALASLKRAVSDVVSVRRTDETARPLMAPDAVYFLRANLGLQLQAARLALLRGEQSLFLQSLDDATAWLREYYDTDSAPVQSALETLAEVRENSFTAAMPDVSQSLRMIRDYTAFVDAATRDEGNAPEITEDDDAVGDAVDENASVPEAAEEPADTPETPEQEDAVDDAVGEGASTPEAPAETADTPEAEPEP